MRTVEISKDQKELYLYQDGSLVKVYRILWKANSSSDEGSYILFSDGQEEIHQMTKIQGAWILIDGHTLQLKQFRQHLSPEEWEYLHQKAYRFWK